MSKVSQEAKDLFLHTVSNLHTFRKACNEASLEELEKGRENIRVAIRAKERKQLQDVLSASGIPKGSQYEYTDKDGRKRYWSGKGKTPDVIERAMKDGAELDDFMIAELKRFDEHSALQDSPEN